MKKILFFATALAGLFLAGSCQRENLEPAGNTVTYTVQLADAVGTKAALGDDISAVDQLVYEVWRTEGTKFEAFDAKKDKLLYHRTADVDNGVANIELEFVNDQNFIVLFWAHTAGNNVYNVEHLTNVTIDSPDVANNPDAQAFVGRDFVRDCVSDKGGKVTLTRPVAQLNIGTTYASLDAFNPGNEADVTITGSSVKVTGLATSYNIATLSAGEASTEEYKYNYDDSCPLPTAPLNVNGTDYKYVAMNYVGFPANGGSNVTVTYVINTTEGNIDNENAPIENVPVKANYRTNIIGNLITSKTDYIVTLDNTWGTPAEVVEMWDGETLKAPKTNAAGEYVIECASELAWLAAAVNGTLPPTTRAEGSPAPNNFEGKTIILSENIHLNNKEWTPIGKESARFHGTFDGKGHTIYGLSILKYHGQRQHALFGSVAINPTIKNLIIDGANVIMPKGHDDDFYASALISSFYGTLKVQNVTVQNSNFAGNNKIGGLLAHDAECTSMIIDNCHVLNCDIRSTHITDGGNVGGLLGYFQGQSNNEHKITNSSVKESTIIAINSKNSGHRSNGQFVGCLSGKDNQILVIEDCVIEDNDFSQTINGTDPVTYVSPYGVFVGGNRNDDGKGTVIVDNQNVAGTAEELAYLVNNAKKDITIALTADLEGKITLYQKEGVKVTIDGKNYKYTGGIQIFGNNAFLNYNMTIKNINFVAKNLDANTEACIYTADNDAQLNCRARNVAIEKCTFTGGERVVPAIRQNQGGQSENWTIKNCTIDNTMHSFLQIKNNHGYLNVEGCEVKSKNGVNLNQTLNASFTSCKFNVDGYAVRVGGSDATYTADGKTFTFTNCELESKNNDGDAVVIVRGTAANATLNFVNSQLIGNPTISGHENAKVYVNGVLQVANKVMHTESGLYYNGINQNHKSVFYVESAEDLRKAAAYFAGQTHSNEANYVTIELLTNIDLAGQDWTPWDVMWITLNAHGHKISNLNSNLFGYAGAVKVNDLTLENVISSGNQVGTFAAGTEGSTFNNCVLTGINKVTYVDAGKEDNGIGAISGITINSNNNVVIAAGSKVTLEYNNIADGNKTTFNDYLNGYKFTTYEVNSGKITVDGTLEIGGISYAKKVAANGDIAVTLSVNGTETTTRRGIIEYDNRIKSAEVEEGITVIGNRTFRQCKGLETVSLPSSLTEIGPAVFQGCSNLSNVNIPASVTTIGEGAFAECTSLTSISIPEGITRLEKDVLRNTGLVSIQIPASVNYIGKYAFRDCESLTEVKILSPEFTIEVDSFTNMVAPLPTITIYVVNAEMKAYLDSKLTNHDKSYITVQVM